MCLYISVNIENKYLLIGISRSAIYFKQKLINLLSFGSPNSSLIDLLANNSPFLNAYSPFSENV